MKWYPTLLLSLCLSCPVFAREPAFVRLYCHSLRFEPASGGLGQTATLRLTTDASYSEINGELAPFFDSRFPSHGSLFLLEDPTLLDSLAGRIAFDKPAPVDKNDNAFDDFFEVSQEVIPTSTSGFFETPVDNGVVKATWSRAAGASTGTCRLELTGDQFGELPTFETTFELIEYTGTFAYVPNTNAITGAVTLTQTFRPANTLNGPLILTRVATNRLNELVMPATTWTNEAGLALRTLPGGLDRDELSNTNYYGFVEFTDGDPATSTEDFLAWVLSIDDLNDTDRDGVPDLSDDPAFSPSSGPSLALSRAADQLLLTLAGEVGRTYDLEETAEIESSTWLKTVTVTLTNATQTLSVSLPATPTRFWRARTQP